MAEPKIVKENRVLHTRMSVSIPRDVAGWVRWRAATTGQTMSNVVTEAITNLYRDEPDRVSRERDAKAFPIIPD